MWIVTVIDAISDLHSVYEMRYSLPTEIIVQLLLSALANLFHVMSPIKAGNICIVHRSKLRQ